MIPKFIKANKYSFSVVVCSIILAKIAQTLGATVLDPNTPLDWIAYLSFGLALAYCGALFERWIQWKLESMMLANNERLKIIHKTQLHAIRDNFSEMVQEIKENTNEDTLFSFSRMVLERLETFRKKHLVVGGNDNDS